MNAGLASSAPCSSRRARRDRCPGRVLPALQDPSPSDRPGQDARPVHRYPPHRQPYLPCRFGFRRSPFLPPVWLPRRRFLFVGPVLCREHKDHPQTAFGSHLAVGALVLGWLCVLPGRQGTFSESSTTWTSNSTRHGAPTKNGTSEEVPSVLIRRPGGRRSRLSCPRSTGTPGRRPGGCRSGSQTRRPARHRRSRNTARR